MLSRPLFLIGAARSGTTFVADLIASHPAVAFWQEPKYIWRHGNPRAPHDRRLPEEATPAVSAYIRGAFERYTRERGRARFFEKTPSNCFRVGFIDRVFPDGLFIHLVRDGRDAATSAMRRWLSPPDDLALWRRLRKLEIPLGEIVPYASDIVREALWRRIQPNKGHIWGPRYPGIHEDLARLGAASVCALQWVRSEQAAREDLKGISASRALELRYEQFVADPGATLARIFEFAGLEPRNGEPLQGQRREARADISGSTAYVVSPEDRERIAAICLPFMREAGIATAEEVSGAQAGN
jgi:hypothetical protein